MNVVMTESGRFVEVQGTAEGMSFSRGELDELLGAGRGRHHRARSSSRSCCCPIRPSPAAAAAEPGAPRRRLRQPGQGGRDRRHPRPAGVELEPRPTSVPDVVEDADTLEGNARLKAVAIADAVGAAAVADDTGLEVDALDGAPGVLLGPLRRRGRDLRRQRGQAARRARPGRGGRRPRPPPGPVPHRGAGALPDGTEVSVAGVGRGPHRGRGRGVSGASATTPSSCPTRVGGRTFAEMTAADKHAVSHRGRAFRALATRSPRVA